MQMGEADMSNSRMDTTMGSGSMPQGNMSGTHTGATATGTRPENMGDVRSMMGSRTSEVMDATARNTASGWAEGHGTAMATGGHGTDSGGGGGMM